MAPRLTIVMPLRGRNLFTLRYLYQADRLRMPHRFLVADGLVHPKLAEILENSRSHFPNLDITYVRYPDDQNFSYYFNKLSDAAQRVTTPYAMLVDNDDFALPAGLEKALDFLDGNPDYVACSGRILGFSVYSGLDNSGGGLRGRLNRLYMYYSLSDASDPSVTARLRRCGVKLWPFYSVMRTQTLATICGDVAELAFSDLLVHETYHAMRLMTLGRARMEGGFATCIRQYGTSLNMSFKKDWVHHLVRSRFTQDIAAQVSRISQAAVAQGADPATIAEELYSMLDWYFRRMVKASYGSMQEFKRLLRQRAPRLVQWYKNRPRFGISGEEAALLREMKRNGAGPDYEAAFRREIAVLRDVLSGPGFAEFIRPFEPVFAAADANRKASNLG